MLAAELIGQADAVVAVGCALNDWTTRHGRHRPIARGILGDGAAVAGAAARALAARPDAARAGWRTEELAARLAARRRWNDEDLAEHGGDLSEAGDGPSGGGRIDPRVLTAELDRLLPAQRIVAVDSGNFMGYPVQWLRVPDEDGLVFTQAFQAIGLGLGTALGAALARPDRLPVLAAGDGGFLMGVAELETAVRLGLPLCAVVYDDAGYGAEVHHFGADADLGTVTFPDADLAARRPSRCAAGRTWPPSPTGPSARGTRPPGPPAGRPPPRAGRQDRLRRRRMVAPGGLRALTRGGAAAQSGR